MSEAREYTAKKWVLVLTSAASFMVALDALVVTTALSTIRADLGASIETLEWIVNAYNLTFAVLLLTGAALGDRFGRRRIFAAGLALFVVASAACALSASAGALIAARAAQGIGAALVMPLAMALLGAAFPREQRGKALGILSGITGIALIAGPVAGGAIATGVDWRWIFWINLPIGAITIALAQYFVPESRAPRARRFDPVGQLLVLTALFTLVYAIIEGPRHGWGSPLIVALFSVSAAAVIGVVLYEPHRAEPLLDLRFFRSLPFASATLIAICMFGAFSGFLFLNALYLQDSRAQSALAAGLSTMPIALATVTFAPISGRLISRYGTRPSLVLAGIAIATGAVMLTTLDATTTVPWLVASYASVGIGFGLANPPITNTAVSGMPRAQAGVAAAVASTSRQIGASLGVALGGTIASTASRGAAAQFAGATHAFWWLAAGAGAAISVLGVVSTGATARASVRRIAALLEDPPPPPPGARA